MKKPLIMQHELYITNVSKVVGPLGGENQNRGICLCGSTPLVPQTCSCQDSVLQS